MRLRAGWDGVRCGEIRTGRGKLILNISERLARKLDRCGVAASAGEGGEPVNGEAIGVNTCRALQLFPVFIHQENPTSLFITPIRLHKFKNMISNIEPLLFALDAVVERGKCPDGAQLRPHVFVAAESLALIVEASADAALLPVHAICDPKRHYTLKQFGAIEGEQGVEIGRGHFFNFTSSNFQPKFLQTTFTCESQVGSSLGRPLTKQSTLR